MIPGFQSQKSDVSLLARGFLTLEPAKTPKSSHSGKNMLSAPYRKANSIFPIFLFPFILFFRSFVTSDAIEVVI